MNLDQQLADQNRLRSWRPCDVAGLKHRWGVAQRVTDPNGGPTAFYWPCGRCPVSVRTLNEVRPRG